LSPPRHLPFASNALILPLPNPNAERHALVGLIQPLNDRYSDDEDDGD
jgi:hypothetical protein